MPRLIITAFTKLLAGSALICLLAATTHATLLPGFFEVHRTIVNSTTRDGSFESGGIVGWTTTSGAALSVVTTAPPGPSHGTYFAQKQGTSTSSGGQLAVRSNKEALNLPAFTLADGDVLRVSIDFAGPSAIPGFTAVTFQLELMNGGSTATGGLLGAFAPNITASDTWFTFEHDYLLPDSPFPTFNGARLRVTFRRTGQVSGTTYTGYLDNLVLQQGFLIPEPSTVFLLGLGGLMLGWGCRQRRR